MHFLKIILFFLFSNILFAKISGLVFQDLPTNGKQLNNYGVKESNEKGIANISVTAYPDNLTTTTDENGSWSLNTTQNSRIEFSNFPTYLKESPTNPKNTSIQFIDDNSTNVTFGLHNINDYSNSINPVYVNNLQQNGNHIGSTTQSLQTVHYESTGLNADHNTLLGTPGLGEIPIDTITMEQIGSVWGKAYQKNKKRLFIASMLQRHIGFANTAADIYVIDYSSYNLGTPPSLQTHFSLEGIIPSNGGVPLELGSVNRTLNPDYVLTQDPTLPNIDLNAYAKVGKISYGGIDIDHNNNKLWLINLNQKGIISIDISGDLNASASLKVNQYLIKDLPNQPTCQEGNLRPWAIKIHKDRAYIGTICDAAISGNNNDLSANIISFSLQDPSLGFKTELSFPLNYQRQLKAWQAWEDVFSYPGNQGGRRIHAQPILSDIEFDENANMYIAFIDRYATQVASTNYSAVSGSTEIEKAYNFGEVLKICYTNGNYEKEGTGNCLQSNYNDSNISEFFNDQGGDTNPEASLGSLALLKGKNEILVSLLDPHPESSTGTTDKAYWYTQGVQTLSLDNGSIKNWYANAYTQSQTDGLNGKANGMGDIELITNAAPIEVGNRIWLDANANGIQDANEKGIENININLVCSGNTVATAITDGNGHYIFSNDSSSEAILKTNNSYKYNIPELIEDASNCSIIIPNIIGTNKQTALQNLILTSSGIGQGANKTFNDSNATINGLNAIITIHGSDIPLSGQNNYGFDVGFKPISTYTLGDKVWIDSNRDGIQDANETGYDGVTVSLYN
ncbi:MAG TPA: hypothetical protein ENK66_07890, partial [Arcobacter sp.]|nr:hypothetical protein [Arcobacter sp.]